MRILVLNSGSSSLKFGLFDVASSKEGRSGEHRLEAKRLVTGNVSGIGGRAQLSITGAAAKQTIGEQPVLDHAEAVRWVFDHVPKDSIEAVGHRVVHGGERFVAPERLDDEVIAEIEKLSELAPLHNPPGLAAIRGARASLDSRIPMVAVFDTAFHAAMPAHASRYAIPRELSERYRIRRYGFHGIAHASLVAMYAAATGRSGEDVRVVTLHLGNGCSAAAIRGSRSIDTSMGFTPLEGLVMGTRSGDLDPALVAYLARREGVEAETIIRWLNERSGLLGVSGVSNDMKKVLEAEQGQDARAREAVDLFCYRARKYLGAYLAVLGGAEAVIFGGGIGEHQPAVRARICDGMAWCGLVIDPQRNAAVVELRQGEIARISRDDATMAAFVAAVDEESLIAQETARVVGAAAR